MSLCYIFGGGEIADYSGYTVPEGAYIIAADGGLRHLERLGIKPDLVLGDFDSYKGELPEDCEVMTVPSRKDDTDTMLAVKTALGRGYRDITLCGALGGRLDHTLANIQTLEYIDENGGRGKILSEDNTVIYQPRGRESYPAKDGFYFSLFAVTEEATVTSRGTKYDLTDYPLKRSFPLGVSNEITGKEATVEIKSGAVLAIYSRR